MIKIYDGGVEYYLKAMEIKMHNDEDLDRKVGNALLSAFSSPWLGPSYPANPAIQQLQISLGP